MGALQPDKVGKPKPQLTPKPLVKSPGDTTDGRLVGTDPQHPVVKSKAVGGIPIVDKAIPLADPPDPTLDPAFNKACIGRLIDQLINPILRAINNVANNKIDEKTINKLHTFINLLKIHIDKAFWPNGQLHFFRSKVKLPGQEEELDIIVTAGTPGSPESLCEYKELYQILKEDEDALTNEKPPFVPRARLIEHANFRKIHTALSQLIEPLEGIKDFPLTETLQPDQLKSFQAKQQFFHAKLQALQRNLGNIGITINPLIPQSPI